MRKVVLGFVIGFVLSIAITLLAGETFYKGKRIYVIADKENLRAEPNGEVLGSLNKGSQLVVMEEEEKWLKVYTAGYIWKESVSGRKSRLAGQPMEALMIVVEEKSVAAEILQKLNAGADFGELAKQYSIDATTAERGGNLGTFYKGDFDPTIEAAISNAEPGEITKVIKSDIGYHIFKRIK